MSWHRKLETGSLQQDTPCICLPQNWFKNHRWWGWSCCKHEGILPSSAKQGYFLQRWLSYLGQVSCAPWRGKRVRNLFQSSATQRCSDSLWHWIGVSLLDSSDSNPKTHQPVAFIQDRMWRKGRCCNWEISFGGQSAWIGSSPTLKRSQHRFLLRRSGRSTTRDISQVGE